MQISVRLWTILASIILLSGCTLVPRNDAKSLQYLTQLRQSGTDFFTQCATSGVNGQAAFEQLGRIVQTSATYLQYEQSKSHNSDSIAQAKEINSLLGKASTHFQNNSFSAGTCTPQTSGVINAATGCLSRGYCKGEWLILSKALSLAQESRGESQGKS